MWKIIIFAAFIVGVSCSKELSERQKSRLHSFVEKTCIKYNAKEKTAEVEQSIYKFLDCVTEHEDPSIIRDLNNVDDQNSAIEVYKRICRKVPEFRTCFYKLLDDTAVCGEKNSDDEIKKAKGFMDQIFDYLCSNDAENFVAFVNDDSLQCIEDKSDGLKGCVEKTAMVLDSEQDNSVENIQESCTQYDDLRKCIHDNLKECPKPTADTFIIGLMDLVRKASRCNV